MTLEWIDSEIPYLSDHSAESLGLRIAFTTRLGGASAGPFLSLNLSAMVGDDPEVVEYNRRLTERAVGFTPGSMTLLRQIHGCDVISVKPGTSGIVGDGDALVVEEPGATGGVLAADCVPLLLAGERIAAAVHAGWRGLVGGVIEAAVAEVGPVTKAWIGPSIKACCYEVGSDVIDNFRKRGLGISDDHHVDPADAAVTILERLDVDDVCVSGICTSCDARFYSHRRDRPTGRQGAFIAWR